MRPLRLLLALAVVVLVLLAGAPPALAAWTWPLAGEVITPYRNGADPYAGGQHRGVDIAGAVGTAVVAAAAGEVLFAGTAGSSGVTVSIRTGAGARHVLPAPVVGGGAKGPAGERGGPGGSGRHQRPPLGRRAASPLRGARVGQPPRLPRPAVATATASCGHPGASAARTGAGGRPVRVGPEPAPVPAPSPLTSPEPIVRAAPGARPTAHPGRAPGTCRSRRAGRAQGARPRWRDGSRPLACGYSRSFAAAAAQRPAGARA